MKATAALIVLVSLALVTACGGEGGTADSYEHIFDGAVRAISRAGHVFHVRELHRVEGEPDPVAVWDIWVDPQNRKARLEYLDDDKLWGIDIVSGDQRALISPDLGILDRRDVGTANELGNPALIYLTYLFSLAGSPERRLVTEETLEGRPAIRVETSGPALGQPHDVQITNIVYLDAQSLLPLRMIELARPLRKGVELHMVERSTITYESALFIPLGQLPRDFFSIEVFGEQRVTPVPPPGR